MALSRTFKFGGLNNVQDPKDVGADFSIVATNVDINDDFSVRRRRGSTLRTAGASLHSLWATPDASQAFVADGSILKKINADLSLTTIAPLATAHRLRYADIAGTVAYLSDTEIGFVHGGVKTTPVLPTGSDDLSAAKLQFKALTTSWHGQALAYYNGRLYVAHGPDLLYSDPYDITLYDTRDYILPLGRGDIQMVAPTTDGLWVAFDNVVAFLAGGGPDEFSYQEKIHAQACYGTDTFTNAKDWGDKLSPAPAVVFMTDRGVAVGLPGGNLLMATDGVYAPGVAPGFAFVRTQDGYTQYLASFPSELENSESYDYGVAATEIIIEGI